MNNNQEQWKAEETHTAKPKKYPSQKANPQKTKKQGVKKDRLTPGRTPGMSPREGHREKRKKKEQSK